jgi:hypothetical protein
MHEIIELPMSSNMERPKPMRRLLFVWEAMKG